MCHTILPSSADGVLRMSLNVRTPFGEAPGWCGTSEVFFEPVAGGVGEAGPAGLAGEADDEEQIAVGDVLAEFLADGVGGAVALDDPGAAEAVGEGAVGLDRLEEERVVAAAGVEVVGDEVCGHGRAWGGGVSAG